MLAETQLLELRGQKRRDRRKKAMGYWHFTGWDYRVLQLLMSHGVSDWGDSEAPRLPLPPQAQMAQA